MVPVQTPPACNGSVKKKKKKIALHLREGRHKRERARREREGPTLLAHVTHEVKGYV